MRNILLDTNVLLDVLLEREPHRRSSEALFAAAEAKLFRAWIAAHAITTIEYLARQQVGAARARSAMSRILRVFEVAPLDGAVLQEAIKLAFSDFEDGVTAAAALLCGCDFIVTRDLKGFRNSAVRVLSPEAMLALLASPHTEP